MATRQILADLAAQWQRQSGASVEFESVGGVDAARRVKEGEAFDVVVLAADAIARLVEAGRVIPDSVRPLFDSGVAVAVRAGQPQPAIATEDEVLRSVLAAPTIGYSTGPSGVALVKQFERWGISERLKGRLVQAPAGVPVGALLARGEVALAFQQLSELIHVEGITVVGDLPPAIQINTTFTAGTCTASQQADAVRDLLDFMTSPQAAQAVRQQGMAPAA